MKKLLVYPDLYEGSALTGISTDLKDCLSAMKKDVKVIQFNGKLTTLADGCLDDPDIFFRHNIETLAVLKDSVENGSNILFVDFLQLGIGLLLYYLKGKNKDVRIGSLFHGASFVSQDYYHEEEWLRPFEMAILETMDVVYAPSQYSTRFFPKDLIVNGKIRVFPFQFEPSRYVRNLDRDMKSFDVILPHRWSWDKKPEVMLEIIIANPDISFAITSSGAESSDRRLQEMYGLANQQPNVKNVGIRTGDEYYKLLQQARVVVALNDTFGYAYREAMASGCIPVLANSSSYPEEVPSDYLFDTIEEAGRKIHQFVGTYPTSFVEPKTYSFRPLLEDFYGR